MKQKHHEVYLNRNELFYLSMLSGAKSIVGVNLPELDQHDNEISGLLENGKKSLLESNAIKENENHSIDIEASLLDHINTVAFRELAILIIRSIKGIGQQQFIYNFHENFIQEHTLPKQNYHRFAFIKDQNGLFERLKEIIPIHSVERKERKELVIKEKVLTEVRELIQNEQFEKSKSILSDLGMSENFQNAFLKGLYSPKLSVSLAAFSMQGDKIRDTSSFSIFTDEKSSWGVWPYKLSKEDSEYFIFPSGINDILSAVNDWISTLKNQ